MEKGISFDTSYLLKFLSSDKKQEIETFLFEIYNRDFISFQNGEDLNEVFGNQLEKFINSLSEIEIANLKTYTGYEFRNINAILRNKWNYEENGLLTAGKKEKYGDLGRKITKVIRKFPSLETNFRTYRGVSIKAFWDYGIRSLEDLIHLNGNFLYESGFTSTSVLKSNSFFEKKSEWGPKCEIEIEYLISEESKDGVLLYSDSLSYSSSQTEYVINSGSLFKVVQVEIDKAKNYAKLRAVLIPKVLWDPYDLEVEDNLSLH